MAWISATTLDGRNANLQPSQIAAILDRVAGRPQEGSVVFLAGAPPVEVKESPAQLLRAIDSEEHPENPPVPPDQAW